MRGDRQVLICPDCQAAYDWIKELDRCQVCGSAHLVRRLGEVECRDCGAVGQPAAALSDAVVVSDALVMANAAVTEAAVADLADQVERALAKVLGPSRRRHAMS